MHTYCRAYSGSIIEKSAIGYSSDRPNSDNCSVVLIYTHTHIYTYTYAHIYIHIYTYISTYIYA